MENKHREPTLYIVGNPERADEIRHIIRNKLGGGIDTAYKYDNSQKAYYVNVFGFVDYCHIDSYAFKNAVAKGWMRELKLPYRPKFKPYDKVVVKIENDKWCADFYSHEDGEYIFLLGNVIFNKKAVILPFNEQTARLIGTRDEWKGGSDE